MPEIVIEYPFVSAMSENRRLNWSPRSRRMFSSREYAKQKLKLRMWVSLKQLEKKAVFDPKKRVHVDIMVYKPDKRSDAQNFIKPILDAVSESIGVNDNVFEGSWGWAIDKENPRFLIKVSQFRND